MSHNIDYDALPTLQHSKVKESFISIPSYALRSHNYTDESPT